MLIPSFIKKQANYASYGKDTKRVTLLTNYGDCSVTTKQIRSKKSSTGKKNIHSQRL